IARLQAENQRNQEIIARVWIEFDHKMEEIRQILDNFADARVRSQRSAPRSQELPSEHSQRSQAPLKTGEVLQKPRSHQAPAPRIFRMIEATSVSIHARMDYPRGHPNY